MQLKINVCVKGGGGGWETKTQAFSYQYTKIGREQIKYLTENTSIKIPKCLNKDWETRIGFISIL